MCSTDVYCSKQTGSSSTKGKPSPIISSFLELGRRNCRCSQNLWRRRKCQQTEPSKIFKWIARFYYFRYRAFAEARVYCSIISGRVAHRYAFHPHCSLIYSGFLPVVSGIVDQPSEGEIILFSGVCQSGRLHYPRRRRWWLHALTDRSLWCATDDDQRQHHHAEHHFQL